MEPRTIRLVVDVLAGADLARGAVITGEVTDEAHDAVRLFSGHLGLMTAIEQAISAAVDEMSGQRADVTERAATEGRGERG